MEPETTTIRVERIEDMESIHGTTTLSSLDETAITFLGISQLATPTLEQSIWSSELKFEELIYVNAASDLDLSGADTESNCSFCSTCISPTTIESSSPLSSVFDSQALFNDLELPAALSKRALTLSTGTFDNNTSVLKPKTASDKQSSNATSPSTPSSYSALSSISTFSLFRKPQPPSTGPILKSSCLQCHLLGLRCSFSSKKQRQNAAPGSTSYCSRCLRNGDEFCITQRISEEAKGELQFTSPDFDILAVKTQAEAMVKATLEKERFALPQAPASVRLGLRRVFRRWEEEENFEDWSLGLLELGEEED